MNRSISASLASAREAAVHRVNRMDALNAICPYYTMFPLAFPLRVLDDAATGDWVLDPFCGRGSTNYAARLRGLSSVGVDSNPVAAAIASAKAVATTPARIVNCCRSILSSSESGRVPTGEFWELCFHPKTLRDLCRIRTSLIENSRSPTRKALLALILGRLHGPANVHPPPSYLSNQMPRTYAAKPNYAVKYWRKRALLPPRVDVLSIVDRFARRYFHSLPAPVESAIVCADSRTVNLRHVLRSQVTTKRLPRFKWIVTSPPYFGMRTYVPDQWLRYWFLGGPSTVDYGSDAQLGAAARGAFVQSLAQVWRNITPSCAVDAGMVVRFGGIPSENEDARDILYESLRLSDSGWRVTTARSAGIATADRRQASQFIRKPASQVAEFDVYARRI
jgi:hypothetical protein